MKKDKQNKIESYGIDYGIVNGDIPDTDISEFGKVQPTYYRIRNHTEGTELIGTKVVASGGVITFIEVGFINAERYFVRNIVPKEVILVNCQVCVEQITDEEATALISSD